MNYVKALAACAVAGGAASMAYLAPHTVFLEKIRVKLARRRFGKELILPKTVRDRLDQVMEDLKIPAEHTRRIKLLEIPSFDIFNMGLVSSSYGAILAIPATFAHEDISTLNKEDIKMFDLPIDWTLDEAQQFAKSLIISDKAQKAALAFAVLKIEMKEPREQAKVAGFYAANITGMYFAIRNRVQNKKSVMVLLLTVGGALWLLAKDFASRNIERECDEQLVTMGPEYVEGSKEYLDKVIERNLAARKLLESYGEKLFSPDGNVRYWWRNKFLPYTARRDFYAQRAQYLP